MSKSATSFPVVLPLTIALFLLGSVAANADDLQSLYKQARDSDPLLRSAEAGYAAAEESRTQVNSLLYPQIALGANLNYTDRNPDSGSSEAFQSHDYSVSLSQPLYRKDNSVKQEQVETSLRTAQMSLDVAGDGLILRLTQAYFQVLAAMDNLEHAQAEKRAISQQLQQTKQRFEVGLIAIIDVHEAQARFDLSTAQEIASSHALNTAREALREITGLPPGELAPLAAELPLQSPEPADPEKWVERAFTNNLELQIASSELERARQEISVRDAGRLPTLDLVAAYRVDDNSDYSMGSKTDTANIGLSFSLPLYTGGATSSRTAEARHLHRQVSEKLEQKRREVARQTRAAYLNVVSGVSQVQAYKQALSSNETALKATEAGLEVGTRTTVDVLNAQGEFYRARRDYAKARYDYILARMNLDMAAGILSEESLNTVNDLLTQP